MRRGAIADAVAGEVALTPFHAVLEAALEQLAEHEGLVLPIRARVQAAAQPGDSTA